MTEVDELRGLLGDARDLVESMGDEPRAEPDGIGYFPAGDEGGIESAIDLIAGHPGPITFFVGAGVSTEAELPSWSGLVRRLLREAQTELDGDDLDLWIDGTLSEGPLAAAAIARALHPTDVSFRQALRSALYDGKDPSDYSPGALASEIAWLKSKMGWRLRIATANYDGLLEAALELANLNPVSYVRSHGEREGCAAVWHLHGRLIRNKTGREWLTEGKLILTEGDYARSTTSTWPDDFVSQCLQGSLCVFLGLSMTDPNFIRWLYRYKSESAPPHIAVFVRQGSPVERASVRRQRERSAAARWRLAGVQPVWTNYYGEVAQLVHEIGRRLEEPGGADYRTRARERSEIGRSLVVPQGDRAFVKAQETLAEFLNGLLQDVRSLAAEVGLDLGAEDMGLGLWGVDHETGIAELWGTSEQVWLDRNALEERSMHVDTRWVGVRAIMAGIPVEQDPAVYTTRWRFIRAIPLIVDPAGDRVIVGALTLTSTRAMSECPLSIGNAQPGLLRAIDEALVEGAASLFS